MAEQTNQGGPRRSQKPARRVLGRSEGSDSGEEFVRARKSVQQGVAEAAQMERDEATKQQKKAGIKEPFRHRFLPTESKELDAALSRIWYAGKQAKDLYIKLGKGLASMDRADVLELGAMEPEVIEDLAQALNQGLSLRQIWKS